MVEDGWCRAEESKEIQAAIQEFQASGAIGYL